MKIAVLSDIHEGLNRKKTECDIMGLLKDWILEHEPDVFIISGDIAADPEKAYTALENLQSAVPGTQLLFVNGNHDIYAEDSQAAYEKLLRFPGNLANGPVELVNDWVIIGDGGWYDYSFGVDGFSEEEFAAGTYKDYHWPDMKYANWPGTDAEETERSLERLEGWLKQYESKNIIMVTHVIPFSHYLRVKNIGSWDFFNAMMGSSRYGELALKYGVKKYIFGHIHLRYHEMYEGIEVICNPLGYYPSEWQTDSAEEEIASTIKTFEIE